MIGEKRFQASPVKKGNLLDCQCPQLYSLNVKPIQKRTRIALLSALLLVGSLTACNSPNSTSSDKSESAGNVPVASVPAANTGKSKPTTLQAVPQSKSVSTNRTVAQDSTTNRQENKQIDPLEGAGGEGYQQITDNAFLKATLNPLSTFSIDVDTASYSNVRRFINEGQIPPQDAVRIEEMVNYFKYDYPEPQGSRPFSVTTEVASAPWNQKHKLLKIGLQGKRLSNENLPPSNLTFLIDVSGSMSDPNKLPLVKSSLRLLVNELRPQDRVSIVVYAGNAGLVLPSTPANQKQQILQAIDRLEAGGSTAGGEGISLAYKVAQDNLIKSGNNRVILASDGDFNVGISSESELVKLIEENRNQGIFLTVLGFGTGNLQDSKMEQIADKGNGNYAYIDSLLEAKKALVKEMGGSLYTLAKDVKLQVQFNPQKVQAYRLIGYENRQLANQDFNDDKKDAGELGAGHTVTALYEIIPTGVKSDVPIADTKPEAPTATTVPVWEDLVLVNLRYKEPDKNESQLFTERVGDRFTSFKDASTDFKFASSVASFGMILRNSPYKGNATVKSVLELATQSQGTDLDGYRAEFVRLVQKSQELLQFK
jgi:Ca-activated chloride channel family protein